MEAKREAKEREFGDWSIQTETVLFTAGTAVLMACLKRFILMFFSEQWRLWVFLLLNVVLVAIFFTSMPSKEDTVKIIKRKKPQCGGAEKEKCVENVKQESIEYGKNESEDEEEEEEAESKEELNERVEAFIATFRRHLVSDAIRGRDHYCFSQKHRKINGGFVNLGRRTSINFSTQGGKRFVL